MWLADDAKQVASSKEDAEHIRTLVESGSKYGLNLNKMKTKILHVRGTKDIKKMGEYAGEEVQYLGVNLGENGRNSFRAEKRMWIKKQRKKLMK